MMNLDKGLSILFIFSKNQRIASLLLFLLCLLGSLFSLTSTLSDCSDFFPSNNPGFSLLFFLQFCKHKARLAVQGGPRSLRQTCVTVTTLTADCSASIFICLQVLFLFPFYFFCDALFVLEHAVQTLYVCWFCSIFFN